MTLLSGQRTLNDPTGAKDTFAPAAVVLAKDEAAAHPDGPLNGLSPQVGPAWITTGASPTVVQNGRFTSAGTGYAALTLDEPATFLECTQVFGGTSASLSNTLAWAKTPFDSDGLNDLLHFNHGAEWFNLTLRQDGGNFDVLMNGTWRRPCKRDQATPYRMGIHVRGETVAVIGPSGEVFAASDPRVAELAQSRTVFIEPNGYGGPAWSEVIAFQALRRDDSVIQGMVSPLDLLMLGEDRGSPTYGNREDFWEVAVGQHPTSGFPALVLGPRTIRTRLSAAVAVGATQMVTEQPIWGTVQLGGGAEAESVTTTGIPNPIPGGPAPFTINLSAPATKAHDAGDVAVTTAVLPQVAVTYNPFSGITLELSAATNIMGDIYRSGTKVVGSRMTGWTAATGTAARNTFDTASATTGDVAQHLKALIDDLIAHGMIGP